MSDDHLHPHHDDTAELPDADATEADAVAADPDGPTLAEPFSFAPVGSEPTRAGFVAIVGKPNVGKSTLLNTLLGVKVAPISSKPQTTRRGVRGIYSADHRQLVFVDTPGFHRGVDALDKAMAQEVREAVVDVELILWVVDLRRPPGDEDKGVARFLQGLGPDVRVWLVGNKIDVAKYPDEALALYRDLYPKREREVVLSALADPKAVYALREDLLALLPESPWYFPGDASSDQTREQWAGEIVREAAMVHLRQELPYAVAVQTIEWRDPRPGKDEPLVIVAEIWVEKVGHRPIVLGKGGKMIREIGKTARKQLEIFLNTKVYLELDVVVRRDWRDDREALRELGFPV
ncbi:MAG: GTPase Era [Trueperaceae bacterium]|nr:GTPase Era [Trueperaceae bacterium]